MSELTPPERAPADIVDEPSLAEAAARRIAARSQWQKALARARDRFTPSNVTHEMVEHAAEGIGSAADKGAHLAWAHRGKIALAGLLGGLFVARKPIAQAAAPLARRTQASLQDAARAFRKRIKG